VAAAAAVGVARWWWWQWVSSRWRRRPVHAGGWDAQRGPAVAGKNLEIKQVAGVVAITSAGYRRGLFSRQRARSGACIESRPPTMARAQGRDMRARDRGDGPPPISGWDDKTLVVQSGNPDDDPSALRTALQRVG